MIKESYKSLPLPSCKADGKHSFIRQVLCARHWAGVSIQQTHSIFADLMVQWRRKSLRRESFKYVANSGSV